MQSSFDLILPFFPETVQPLILDNTISDLMIIGDSVFIDQFGQLIKVQGVSISSRSLDAAIENIARQLGGDFSRDNPILDSKLPDGSRVGAVHNSCSPNGTTLTIRRFTRQFTTEELIAGGTLTREARDYVINAILDHKNGIVSGGTSSGKTTLLGSFIRHIPEHERLIVIEKPAELKILHQNTARWEARDAVPGTLEVTTSQLLVAALRHRPDRIIVGEVRDHSAYDLLQAMNTGHSGTLSTVHADNATDALFRISELALSAYQNLRQDYTRKQTARALDFVLHAERSADGQRRITELLEVHGYDPVADLFETKQIYRYEEQTK